MSNSVPARIVDKNGKTTTVYRKPEAPSVSASRLPAPALISDRNPRHLVIDSIMETLRGNFTPADNTLYRDKMIDISRNLSGAEDDEYPQRVLEMVSKVAPALNNRSVDIRPLVYALANSDHDEAESLCSHADYLAANPRSINNFFSFRKGLMEELRLTVRENIEAHTGPQSSRVNTSTRP